MLEFPEAPFLVLHFSYHTLMTFLTMLSVMLLSLLILLSILSVIKHLIWGNNLKWLLNLNLIYETLCTVTSLITMVLITMDGSVLLRCLAWPSHLNWIGALALSPLLKLPQRKFELSIYSMKFLSPEVALYLYKSSICPCMEYSCHVWAGAPSCHLELLDKLFFGSSSKCGELKSFLKLFGRCSSELA